MTATISAGTDVDPAEAPNSSGVFVIAISERIFIAHPPATVWSVLSDPETVVTLVEGSRIGEHHDDGTFDAFLAVRFAGIKVAFKAVVDLTLHPETLTGRLEGTGGDSRGSTRVKGDAEFAVISEDGGSTVTVAGGAEVTGALAGLVSTGASIVVARMVKSFTKNLALKCAEVENDESETAR